MKFMIKILWPCFYADYIWPEYWEYIQAEQFHQFWVQNKN